MSKDMDDRLADARKELRDRIKEDPIEDEPHDVIHEIADGSVPIYAYDIIQAAAEDVRLATAEPEIGPAFDGTPTPTNIIAANIFEAIEAALWDEWEDIQTERVEAEEAAAELAEDTKAEDKTS